MNLQKYLDLLHKDSIQKLCDLLGKLTKAQQQSQLETYLEKRSYTIHVPTPHIKEHMSGVTLGRDLENILPSELALLEDPDFGILFDLKYAQNRLFCFEKQGYASQIRTEEIEAVALEQIEEKKGPMILCVDTSGSMSGAPELIAKTLTLFMAKHAMEDKRPCYLIGFNSGVQCLDLTPPNGLFKLMSFLEICFNGGTDALPAFQAGMQKMQEETYSRADLLLMSDFIFSPSDVSTIQKSLASKDQDNRVYALYVGHFSKSALGKLGFEGEFIYDPSDHSVKSLCQLGMQMQEALRRS